jgi:hypothetical protein
MTFKTTKTDLTITMDRREQLWAMKAKIIVAKSDIVSVNYCETFKSWRKWEVRLPGTGMPQVLVAGSFWTEEGWDFLYLKRPHGFLHPFAHNVLVIETKLSKYRRIVISVPRVEIEPVLAWANK